MNLYIRSQFKEMLFKVNNNLIIKYNNNNENGMYFIECDGYKIAMYKTRERALEVLDEIQEKLSLYSNARVRGEHQELLLKLMAFMISEQIIVYEMPKE